MVATATDPNSQVTSFSYNTDTLRTDHVDFANGGRVSYDYGDNLVADSTSKYHFRITATTKLDSSRYVDSKAYFDGRGAVAATFNSYTSGNGWSIRNIQYDSMGRAYRASNPYFSTSDYGTVGINSAGIWTTNTFDNLGRVTQMTMPRGDDANPSYTVSVQSVYNGEVTTVTDQTGKQRRSVSDALGRVIKLHEPNSSGALGTVSSPNQETQYLYDVLNNLAKITQGAQNRYFKYDSLSRLIREKQVEEDYYSGYNLSDSLTNNSYWSRKFEYNSHGLVTHSYDALGFDTGYEYDALNRLTLINYGDSTPDAHFYYDSQTLPSGAPSYTHGSANGRLIAATYGSGATGTYYGYDVMGRVNVQKQVTGSNTYSLAYGYNLAGLLTSETYPTNRVVSYSYDNAGRLSQVSDGTTTFADNFAYAPTGAPVSETWGNSAVRSIAYNNAHQVSQIKLKQSSSGSELQRYDYLYGTVTQSNGNVDKSKNNGQVGRIDGTINGSSAKEWEQRFSYDELGRLSTAAEYQQGTGGTPTWRQVFTYDRYGNRFQSGSSNSGVGFMDVVTNDISTSTNRFISTGSTPVTYDPAGNITQDQKFRFMNYSYDANGRQLSASSINNAASQTSVYDAAGRRVQTTANNVTRTMVYDIFGQLVADYNGTTMQRENIYRGGQILAVYEASSSCYKSITDFVTGFYQGALSRNPNSTELAQWTNTLSQAQARGHAHLIAAAQSLGATIFTSSEYTNLSTSNGQFVTDLYEAYLQRTPDSEGYNAWVAALATNSRTVVRNGFAYSTEFQSNVVKLCVSTGTSAALKYVLTDVQGSARVLMENNGTSSAILARHDYLPFGEEIWAGVGLRTTTQKYASTDNVRQGFAMTERDETTGLDHTWFRKYESIAGRWTSPDAVGGGISNPQSFNRYAYVRNDPVNLIDPAGLEPCEPTDPCYVFGWSPTLIDRTGSAGSLGTNTGFRIVEPFPEGPGGPVAGGPIGGGPTGDHGPTTTPTQDPSPSYNNCYQFVQYLVNLATGVPLNSPSSRQNRQQNRAAVRNLGARLVREARDYGFINNLSEGFKDTLTGGFQNAGVYGHVLLQAGEYLVGGGIGQLVGAGFRAYDNFQQASEPLFPHQQNDQRPAEIAGNEAGLSVGRHVWSYLTGHRDPKVLADNLTETLCKPDGGT